MAPHAQQDERMRLAIDQTTRRLMIAIGVIILLVMVLLPPALGTQAQRAYQDLLRATLQSLPNARIVQDQYDRGWFGSQARTEVALSSAGGRFTGTGATLRVDSHIDQGPWAWFSGGFDSAPYPSLTLVQTRVEWAGGPVTLPPLRITTHIGTDGSGYSRLRIPATDQAGATDGYRLLSNEISGTVRHRLDPPQLMADLLIPAIALLSSTGPMVSLADARLRGDLSGGIGGPFTGRVDLEVGAAQLGGPSQASPPANEIYLERLRMTLEQDATGTRQRLNLRLNAAANHARLGTIDYRSPLIGLSAQSLDWSALAEVGGALRTLSSDRLPPAVRGLAGATLLTQLLPRFLATGPSITLEPFRLDTPDGPITAHLTLDIAARESSTQGPNDLLGSLLGVGRNHWLADLKGDGTLGLPQSVAREWIERANPQSATSPADQLQAWIDQGWITAHNGSVSSHFRITDGALTINGKPLPLLPGLGR